MSAALATDSYDDIEIGGGHYAYGVDIETLERVAERLSQGLDHLENCDRTLNLMARADRFSHGANFGIPLPTADPAQTWLNLEEQLDRARFGAVGIENLTRFVTEIRDNVRRTSRVYLQAQKRIEASWDIGYQIGTNIGPYLMRAATLLPHMAVQNALLRPFLKARYPLPVQAGEAAASLTFGDGSEVLRFFWRNRTFVHMVANQLGPDERAAFVDNLIDVIFGNGELAAPAYEVVAGIYGIYTGTSDVLPIPYAGPVVEQLIFIAALDRELNERAKKLDSEVAISVTLVNDFEEPNPPAGLADLSSRSGDQYPATTTQDSKEENKYSLFEIELKQLADGTPVAFIHLPGMAYARPHKTHPNDGWANVQAIQGQETAQSRAVKQALAELGVPRGAWLVLSGHSKGGMDALTLSQDPEITSKYRVFSVNTFGTPSDLLAIEGLKIVGARRRDLNGDATYLNIKHHEDVVPGADIQPPISTENRTDITLSYKENAVDSDASKIEQAHAIENYTRSAERVAEQDSAAFQEWRSEVQPVFEQDGAPSHRYQFKVEKQP